jgi:hypothetical protein
MVGNTKIGSNFVLFGLLSKGLFGGNFEQKHPWSFRGLKIYNLKNNNHILH